MRLTKFADYSLRVLILAASKDGRNVTIEEAAAVYGISAAHLKKVVRTLTSAGLLGAQRGRQGGFRLIARPEEINLGRVIRATEPDFALVECFGKINSCVITRSCALPRIFDRALCAMFAVLDEYTLADLVIHGEDAWLRQPGSQITRKQGDDASMPPGPDEIGRPPHGNAGERDTDPAA